MNVVAEREKDPVEVESQTVCQLNVRTISPDLRSEFRQWCERRGYSTQRAVVALIRLALRRNLQLTGADDERLVRNKG